MPMHSTHQSLKPHAISHIKGKEGCQDKGWQRIPGEKGLVLAKEADHLKAKKVRKLIRERNPRARKEKKERNREREREG